MNSADPHFKNVMGLAVIDALLIAKQLNVPIADMRFCRNPNHISLWKTVLERLRA